MGDGAFYGCDAFNSVTIPDSVTSIGDFAFESCDALTNVYYTGTEEQWKNILIESNNSNLLNATIHYNYIPQIIGLKVKAATSSAVRLEWEKEVCADGYIVEMYSGGKWTRIAKLTSNDTTEYRKSGLAAGTAYSFRIKAYKMDGSKALYSGYSYVSARTNPSKVSGLALKGRAADALRIGWTKNTSADGYIVEMYSGGKWTRIAKLTSNATTEYRKSGLKGGTAYKFRVRTYKMSGSTPLYSGYSYLIAKTK